MDRRQFLQAGAASLFAFNVPFSYGNDIPKGKNKSKFVWVLLRGALDPLHTIVPRNNNELIKLRPTLYPAIKDNLLPLNDDFGFHPKLENLHRWYQNKELSPIVAVSSGYQQRSHFEGQDFLESGLAHIDLDNGWLARAINVRQAKALAVVNAMPLSLRGSALAGTWYPSRFKNASNDLHDRLLLMYQNDVALHANLTKGLELKQTMNQQDELRKKGHFTELCRSCGKLLVSSDIECAVLELGGWDTHNRQAPRLDKQLSMLDQGLAELKSSLGNDWNNTVIVVATEFGRTAKENGTFGTDHGTASSMMITGGNVKGGNVIGTWPGLSNNQLFEERDLMPTTNSFDWISKLLVEHWTFSASDLKTVFPDFVLGGSNVWNATSLLKP